MDRISPELAERMAELIRDLHVDHLTYDMKDRMQDFVKRTAAIVAELPEPIDPDVLMVREILHVHQRAMAAPDSGWGNMSYRAGSYDNLPAFVEALAAYKAIQTGGAA